MYKLVIYITVQKNPSYLTLTGPMGLAATDRLPQARQLRHALSGKEHAEKAAQQYWVKRHVVYGNHNPNPTPAACIES